MTKATKRKLGFLAGFVLYFGLLWYFWESVAVYPLKIFVVLLHEASHALALWATGGTVDSITLDPYQGGATYGRGGSRVLTLSAGYLGSLLWGVALVMAAHARKASARWITFSVGALIGILTVVFVRSLFGVTFGLLFGVAMLASGHGLGELWNRRILLVLGLTSCLYAILDIKSDVLDRPELRSDAAMLAEVTGIPGTVWGVLWIALAVGVSAWLFRWAWRRA